MSRISDTTRLLITPATPLPQDFGGDPEEDR